jgi:hypothetical protein
MGSIQDDQRNLMGPEGRTTEVNRYYSNDARFTTAQKYVSVAANTRPSRMPTTRLENERKGEPMVRRAPQDLQPARVVLVKGVQKGTSQEAPVTRAK